MAINRLMLRCERCDETVVVARLSAAAMSWEPSWTPIAEYTAWLERHSECGLGVLHVGLCAENDTCVRLAAPSHDGPA